MEALLNIKKMRADTAPLGKSRLKPQASVVQVGDALNSLEYQESTHSYQLSHKKSRESISRVGNRGGRKVQRSLNGDLIAELKDENPSN